MDSTLQVWLTVISLLADAVVMTVAAMTATGRLTRQGWAGIRTRATRASDEAWSAAHRVAYPICRDSAAVNATIVIVAFFVPSQFQLYLIQVATGALLVGVVVAGVLGHRAAKALTRES
jgi:hypothetical protein